ncbi:MAG: alpha-D-ribose 1-methylphosphonate 5-triphosphate diphosphatase [Geminicoccaceae bacterium]
MSSEVLDEGRLAFANASLVLEDQIVAGHLLVEDGHIADLDGGASRDPHRIDLEGDYLIPGLVDLHTDNLEKHYQPRKGVEWDAVSAAISHDAQVAGAGITTVFDSLTLGAATGWDVRAEMIGPMVEGLRIAVDNQMLKVNHFLHLRCEVTHRDIGQIFETYVDDPLVRFMSLMDHAPGDRQSPDMDRYRQLHIKLFDNDPTRVDAHIEELLHGSTVYGPVNRKRLASTARAKAIPFASHDDRKVEHITEAADLGAVLTEFPTTVEAASAARERGLLVVMGSPNLIRGGSHSGNVAASTLVESNLLDALASDYIPASLLLGALRLTREEFGFELPDAIAMVTSKPARTAGLDDRGRIAKGLRADLIQVRMIRGRPVVRRVWCGGRRVA